MGLRLPMLGSCAVGQAGFGAGSGVREEKGHIPEAEGRVTTLSRAAEVWLLRSGCVSVGRRASGGGVGGEGRPRVDWPRPSSGLTCPRPGAHYQDFALFGGGGLLLGGVGRGQSSRNRKGGGWPLCSLSAD